MPTPQDQRDDALRQLNARADALARSTARPPSPAGHSAAVNQAYRIVIELFGGVLVGLALGFGVDRLAGTEPWGLIGGVLMGFAVAIYMARRTANRLMAQAAADQAAAEAAQPPRPGSQF